MPLFLGDSFASRITLAQPKAKLRWSSSRPSSEPDTLESMDNVALALSYHGNHDEAEGMHRRTLEGREKALGKEHLDTLSSMNNMASVLH
jgi:hypothetical protein